MTAAATSEAVARARRVVGPRTGIVHEVAFGELAPGDPAFWWARSLAASLVPIAGDRGLNHGNSTSVDRDRAIVKAVGESIERYCSAIYDERELVTATFEELDGAAIPPEEYALFSGRQYARPGFRHVPFTRTTRLRWTQGWSLVHERATWVPAQLVYVPYRRAAGEATVRDMISTGLAAGPSRVSATVRAALEAVERDAFSIVWHNRISPPRIDLTRVRDPFAARQLEAFRGVPVRMHALLLTLDLEVAVVLIVMRRDEPPYTTIGVGTDLSPARALGLALEEAGLGIIGMSRFTASEPGYRARPDGSDITELKLHGLAHAVDPAWRESVEFLLASEETIAIDDVPDRATGTADGDLATVVEELGAKGHDLVALDLTTPDVDEVGYKVVRAIVPALVPLDNDHTHRHLGGRRIYEVPHRLGLVPRPLREDELNSDPHPFP